MSVELSAGRPGPIRCPVCAQPILVPMQSAVIRWCRDCVSPHHVDCWNYNEGCAVYGCSPRKSQWVIEDEPPLSIDPIDSPIGAVVAMALLVAVMVVGSLLMR